MKRRDFIRNMMIMGMGLALAPEVIAKQVAEAAWQDGGNVLPGVAIRQTHLSFRSLTNRRVTDAIIVHHIGNTNADVSAETVHQWHLANGWAGIGYHFLIRKDGFIEQGRPMDTVGAHCYGRMITPSGSTSSGILKITCRKMRRWPPRSGCSRRSAAITALLHRARRFSAIVTSMRRPAPVRISTTCCPISFAEQRQSTDRCMRDGKMQTGPAGHFGWYGLFIFFLKKCEKLRFT